MQPFPKQKFEVIYDLDCNPKNKQSVVILHRRHQNKFQLKTLTSNAACKGIILERNSDYK